jgi:hypothetical protein
MMESMHTIRDARPDGLEGLAVFYA